MLTTIPSISPQYAKILHAMNIENFSFGARHHKFGHHFGSRATKSATTRKLKTLETLALQGFGGGGGIRTHVSLARQLDFEICFCHIFAYICSFLFIT